MLTHKGTLGISAERLLLRRFKPDDFAAMFANWASDPEVTRFVSFNPHSDMDETKEIIAKWVAEYGCDDTYHWAIELDGEVIGDIKIFTISDKHASCELGYVMSRKYWGRGYMTEAVKAVIAFLFMEVNMHRITAKHSTENPASGRVMQKAEMLREGTFRKARKSKQGVYCDMDYYAVLKEDWEQH